MSSRKRKHCGANVRLINFALGAQWMHENTATSFPTILNGGLWEFFRINLAEPEETNND